jgi:hypothetical protein
MEATGTIHYAKYQESARLQRLLAFMLHGQPRTGLEIIVGAQITAVSAAACELRENGFDFRCIKQNNPPTYMLFNVEKAKARAAELMERRAA